MGKCLGLEKQGKTSSTHVSYLLVEERRAWLGAVTPNTPEGTNATPAGAFAAATNAHINVERIMVPTINYEDNGVPTHLATLLPVTGTKMT